jgi:hypothetical protein
MAIERKLTAEQTEYFESLDVDPLIDPEVFEKHSHLVDKIRKGIKAKFFDNLEKILKKWSCEIPGNTHISLNLIDRSVDLKRFNTDYSKLCLTPVDDSFFNPELSEGTVHNLDSSSEIVKFEEIIHDLLTKSMGTILENVPEVPHTLPLLKVGYSHTKANLGILFSGGLDSTLLAALAARTFPKERKIDLYNISFLNSVDEVYTKCTFDRECSLNSFKDLEKLYPGRFNLILIDHVYDSIYKIRDMSHVNPEIKESILSKINSVLEDIGEKTLNIDELEQIYTLRTHEESIYEQMYP